MATMIHLYHNKIQEHKNKMQSFIEPTNSPVLMAAVSGYYITATTRFTHGPGHMTQPPSHHGVT